MAVLALIGVTIPSKIHSDIGDASQGQTRLSSLLYNPTTDQIKEAISYIAIEYGLNRSSLIQTIKCESSLKHKNVYGDSSKAYGLAQFHKPTFDRFCKGDYYLARDQLICFAEMVSKGLQKHWTCWKGYLTK